MNENLPIYRASDVTSFNSIPVNSKHLYLFDLIDFKF